MPDPETSDLLQKATYWSATGNIDKNGKPTVTATEIQINVRWLLTKDEIIDSFGTVVGFDELAIVDRVIPIHSILWLGKLEDLPSPLVDLREVIDFKEIPDALNRVFKRTVKMIRFGNRLPTTE